MKKTPRKLVLRSETLRALTNLDLAHVVGGLDPGDNGQVVLDTGRKDCPTWAVVMTKP